MLILGYILILYQIYACVSGGLAVFKYDARFDVLLVFFWPGILGILLLAVEKKRKGKNKEIKKVGSFSEIKEKIPSDVLAGCEIRRGERERLIGYLNNLAAQKKIDKQYIWAIVEEFAKKATSDLSASGEGLKRQLAGDEDEIEILPDGRWICPNDESINSGNACMICGWIKEETAPAIHVEPVVSSNGSEPAEKTSSGFKSPYSPKKDAPEEKDF